MIVTGMSSQTFKDIVAKLNATDYAGNIVVENITDKSANRFSVKLGTADSKAPTSRTSASGRHGKYLCWHGFRDVVAAVMDVNPSARVATGMAVYAGKDGFEQAYPETAYKNIGSLFAPAYMPELCSC